MQKYTIKDVQIFSAGEWNDEKFTTKDLENMVKSFDETKSGVKPYIKLGHDKNQKIAKNSNLQKDGLPALGWIDKMSVTGDKLIADLVDIPKKVYDLIKIGAYKKVSCEMFFNVKIKDKRFSHLITAISLLGADTPAVMNLDDIHSLYFEAEADPKAYASEFIFNEETQTKEQIMAKTENEIKLEVELENQKKEFTATKTEADEAKAKLEAAEKENTALKEFKANAEKVALENEIALKAEKVKTFAKSLVTEKLASPAMEPLILELLSDKKEFSVKVGDKDLKTKEDIVKELCKLSSVNKDINVDQKTAADKTFSADKEKQVEEKIKSLQKDNPKLSYKKAYSQAMKEC
jgi:hypothetical protein